MKKTLFIFTLCIIATQIFAQNTNIQYKGHFYNKEYGIHLNINLYEETLEIPGYKFLGNVHGYMNGQIYGTWFLTKHEILENQAKLRFSNDQGADSQTIIISHPNDSTLHYRAIDGNNIKRVEKKKLVKIPQELTFRRIK
jgi:hypothetical protein